MTNASSENKTPGAKSAARFSTLAVMLAFWVVLGITHAIWERKQPTAQPLPPYRSVVLLVVPGLDAGDRNDKRDAPELATLSATCPIALVPIPAFVRRPAQTNTVTSPDDRLVLAYQALFGKSGLSNVPGASHSVIVLDALGIAAPVVFGDAQNAAQNRPPLNGWQVSVPESAGGQGTDPALFAQTVRAAIASAFAALAQYPPSSPVLVVAVLDDLYRADTYAPLCTPEAAQQERRKALKRVSRSIAALTNGNKNNADAVLLVAPLAPASRKEENERMGFLLLWTPQPQQGGNCLLTSPSTRNTPGLATFDDVRQSLLQILVPSTRNGRSLQTVVIHGGGAAFSRQKAHWAAQWQETRLLVAVPWILAGLLLASVFCAEHAKYRTSAFYALAACTVPTALWVAPLFPLAASEKWGGGLFLYGLAAVLTTGTAGMLLRRQSAALALQFVAGATVCLLALDTVLGGPLLARSPLSYSVLEGARFYGVGNESAGVLVGASLVFGILARNRAGFWAQMLGGLGIAALSGLPTLGANAGATVAALAGWAALLVLEVPSSHRKNAALFAAVCVVALLTGLVGWESHHPVAFQTHIGQVVTQTQNNGTGGAAQIARRKIAMNAHLAVSSPWAVLLVVETGLCAFLWRKAKKRGTTNSTGAIALFVGAGAAFAANDSGVVMAATCLLFAPPLLLFTSSPQPQTAIEELPILSTP